MKSFALAALLGATSAKFHFGWCPSVQNVEDFDAAAYAGKWYEVYRDRHNMHTHFADCVTKEFDVNEDGNMDLYFRGFYNIHGWGKYMGIGGVMSDCDTGSADSYTCKATMSFNRKNQLKRVPEGENGSSSSDDEVEMVDEATGPMVEHGHGHHGHHGRHHGRHGHHGHHGHHHDKKHWTHWNGGARKHDINILATDYDNYEVSYQCYDFNGIFHVDNLSISGRTTELSEEIQEEIRGVIEAKIPHYNLDRAMYWTKQGEDRCNYYWMSEHDGAQPAWIQW